VGGERLEGFFPAFRRVDVRAVGEVTGAELHRGGNRESGESGESF
jgi:hypothetical protein